MGILEMGRLVSAEGGQDGWVKGAGRERCGLGAIAARARARPAVLRSCLQTAAYGSGKWAEWGGAVVVCSSRY